MKLTALCALVLASGCSLSTTESAKDLESQAEHVSDCCKLEGSEIGREAALVRLGTKTVLVHDWVGKTGEPGEFVGFSLTLSGGSTIEYVVKAGGEKHASTSLVWIHPNGPDGGSASPAISNVDFCGECDNPDGCDPGGGGGNDDSGGGDDPQCDNPDGCGGGGGPVLL